MANLIGGSIAGINIWDWNQYGFDTVVSTSESVYVYETPGGNTVQLIGAEFVYDKSGQPIGGTVEVMAIHDQFGNQIASLVLGDSPLADIVANNFHDFWSVLLAGNDIISTSHQADTVSGFAGNDMIFGGGGSDNLFGGDDDDILDGDSGDDFVNGDAGNDIINFHAEDGDDIIDGGIGDDKVVHNGLNTEWGDFIFIEKGSALQQLQVEQPAEFALFDSKSSEAFAVAEIADPAIARLKTITQPREGDFATLKQRERESNDDITGLKTPGKGGVADLVDVQLRVGSTTGTRNPDEPERNEATLTSIENIDVFGRFGDDNLYVEDLSGTHLENGHIFFDGGAGSDDLHAADSTTAVTYQWRWLEGEGDAGGGNVRFGTGIEDRFHFLDETDDAHNLTLGAGADHVDIWEGISGFGISPDIQIWDAEYLDFDFGGGDDSFVVDFDVAAVFDGVLDIEFGSGTSSLDTTLHTGRVEAVGGDQHNAFFAGSGEDLLIGGASFDDLFGGAGDDEINAGAGDDDIAGGAGNDTLEGGSGFDRFFFEQNGGTDTIKDFEDGIDVLDYTGFGGTIDHNDLVISQIGEDTHIVGPGGEAVILQTVQAATVDATDFLF